MVRCPCGTGQENTHSVCHCIAVSVRYFPLAILATVNLGCPEGISSGGPIEGGRGMFQAGCVSHVPDDVAGLQFELVGRAIREAGAQGREEFIELILPISVPEGAEHAYRFLAGPQGPAWFRVAVVKGQFCLVEGGFDPSQKFFFVAHAASMLAGRQLVKELLRSYPCPDSRVVHGVILPG